MGGGGGRLEIEMATKCLLYWFAVQNKKDVKTTELTMRGSWGSKKNEGVAARKEGAGEGG